MRQQSEQVCPGRVLLLHQIDEVQDLGVLQHGLLPLLRPLGAQLVTVGLGDEPGARDFVSADRELHEAGQIPATFLLDCWGMGPVLQHGLEQLVAIGRFIAPAQHPHRFIEDRLPVGLPGLRLDLLAELNLRFLHGRGNAGPGDLVPPFGGNVAAALHLRQAVLQRPLPFGCAPDLVEPA